MSISLREAMKFGKFNECKVVAGEEGMDRVIENITIMEVPDIVKWLKEKELIITSLFAIKDDTDAQNLLIHRLFYAGATALAVKPFETLEGIPKTIIDNANKLDFPVIEVPNQVKYLDILSPTMHQIFNKKVVLQEDLERATNILQEIALNSHGMEAFVESLHSITQNMVTIESEWPIIKTPEPSYPIIPLTDEQKHELSVLKRPVRYTRIYQNENIDCIVAPIIVDHQYYGNITSWGVHSNHISMDIAVLEQASFFVSLEFLRLKVRHDTEQQYKSDFMRELLFNNNITKNDMLEWGGKYYITEHMKYTCILIQIEKENESQSDVMKLINEVYLILQNKYHNVLLGIVRGKICIIQQTKNLSQLKQDLSIMKSIINEKRSIFTTVCIGVGDTQLGIKGIRSSFNQAEQAVKLALITKGTQNIVFYKELGIYCLLEPLKSTDQLMEFFENTLGKLIKDKGKKELIHTLQEYFNENEVLTKTADKLFIHVNTLKYRLKQIENITSLSFKSSEDKFSIFLGLKIYNLIKGNNSNLLDVYGDR